MRETTRTLILLATAAMAAPAAHAQYATYNHDSPKQNQITVMETGAGALTPELYYWTLHNSYKKSAATKNKLSFRTLAGVNLYNQVDEAESIDSALVKRAEIEALNMADRQLDLAWQVEGDKVNGQMERFKRNIDRILTAGQAVRTTGSGGRNTTTCTSVRSTRHGTPTCPTRSARRSICGSMRISCSRTRYWLSILPGGRTPR